MTKALIGRLQRRGASEPGEPLDPHREADGGHRRGAAEPRQQAVVASAGDELALGAPAGSCSSNTKPV